MPKTTFEEKINALSPRTVEYYFENLKDKLGCSTKRELLGVASLLEKQNLI